MKSGNAFRFVQEINNWYTGEGSLSKANDLLGAPHNWLYDILSLELVIDTHSRPFGAVSCEQIISIILLHVAMRKKL